MSTTLTHTTAADVIVGDTLMHRDGSERVVTRVRCSTNWVWITCADSQEVRVSRAYPVTLVGARGAEHFMGTRMTPAQSARFSGRTHSHTTQEAFGYTYHYTDGSSAYHSIGD